METPRRSGRLHGARRSGPRGLATLLAASTFGVFLAPTCAGNGGAVHSEAGVGLLLTLENEAGEPTSRFAPLETVVLVLSVRNPGPAPVRFELSSTRTHDVAIADDAGRELWRWARARSFAQVLTDFSLDPGETRRLESRWNQHDDAGRPVPSGRYRAVAELAAREVGERVSAVFTID